MLATHSRRLPGRVPPKKPSLQWVGTEAGAERDALELPYALPVVLGLLALVAVGIWFSGGYASPCKALFFLPILITAFTWGPVASLGAALGVCCYFVLLKLLGISPLPTPHAPLEAAVLLLVAVVSGAAANRMQRAAAVARNRAQRVEQKAAELEWFTDTAIMIESLHDLEPMLSIALLRLGELAPCDSAAVYLRDAEDTTLILAQAMGLSSDQPGILRLPHADQLVLHQTGFEARLWSARTEPREALGPLAVIDTTAQAAIIAPLRTVDDLFGVLVVGSRRADAFTEREREQVSRLSRQLVYPIQRVRLHALATTDSLTGLFNQRAFRRRLDDETERSRRYRRPLTLLLLDLDHFKLVNDRYGHPGGDAILAQLGALLLQQIRETDFIARYGGEELAVLCPETASGDGLDLAERIRVAVQNHPFLLSSGVTVSITVSIGIAALPDDARDAAMLLEKADSALYQAKARGRNQVSAASEAGGEYADASAALRLVPAVRA